MVSARVGGGEEEYHETGGGGKEPELEIEGYELDKNHVGGVIP